MHCVYFARHGETVWNVENKICGMTDSPLTEKGRAQAAQLGEAVKNSGIVLDEILYSPLSRAADTALAVAAATGLPARVEPRLREQCFGRFEGTSHRSGKSWCKVCSAVHFLPQGFPFGPFCAMIERYRAGRSPAHREGWFL